MSESRQERIAIRAAFWSWTSIIVAGLTVMILLPLMGR